MCQVFKAPYAVRDPYPCIWLGRGKFESTNQDSASGKKSSVLTSSKHIRKGFEIRQLFSLEMALNIHEKGFTFSKPIPVCKTVKNMNHFVFLSFYFGTKSESPVLGIATRSLFVEYRQVG